MGLKNLFKCKKSSDVEKVKYENYDKLVNLINRYKDDCESLFFEKSRHNSLKKHIVNVTLTHFVNLFRTYIEKDDDVEDIDGAYRLTVININTYIHSVWEDILKE